MAGSISPTTIMHFDQYINPQQHETVQTLANDEIFGDYGYIDPELSSLPWTSGGLVLPDLDDPAKARRMSSVERELTTLLDSPTTIEPRIAANPGTAHEEQNGLARLPSVSELNLPAPGFRLSVSLSENFGSAQEIQAWNASDNLWPGFVNPTQHDTCSNLTLPGPQDDEHDLFVGPYTLSALVEPISGCFTNPETAESYVTSSAPSELEPVSTYNFTQAAINPALYDSSAAVSTSHSSNEKKQSDKYEGGIPKRDEQRDWIRVNYTTSGKSARTEKINTFDARRAYPEAQVAPLSWTSSQTGNVFNYTKDGELKELIHSAERIADFIYNHPKNGTAEQMVLWIQKCPADSARRYPTPGSSKCRFKECPATCYGRTIAVGHYRVAFDEKWNVNGAYHDPFVVSGYVHLYCLERYVDMRDVTARFDVRADIRYMPAEPRSIWAPSLGDEDDREYRTAARFIKYARSQLLDDPRGGRSKFDTSFPDYPAHDYAKKRANENKPHEATLCYRMMLAKADKLNNSKRALLEGRGLKPSHFLVHLGDLRKAVASRRAQVKLRRVSTSSESQDGSDSDAEFVMSKTSRKRKRSTGNQVSHDEEVKKQKLLDEMIDEQLRKTSKTSYASWDGISEDESN